MLPILGTSICIVAIFSLFGVDAATIESSSILGNETATLSDGGAFASYATHRQNFCLRYQEMVVPAGRSDHNDTLTIAPDNFTVRNALAGSELSVSLEPGLYFRYDDVNGIDQIYPGIHARILDYIAQQGGFTWRQSFGVWTREQKGDRSITDILRWGVDKYDIMVGTYTPSTARMNRGISFVSNGHFDGSLVLTRAEEESVTKVNYMSFLLPFDWNVWYVIIAVLLFSSVVYGMLERIENQHKDDNDIKKSLRKWFMDDLYLSLINFTGNYSYEPTTLGQRIFAVFFAFWALLVTAAYTANLASLLVQTHVVSEQPVVDIRDAIDKRLTICVQKSSYAEEYLSDNFPGGIPYFVPVLKPNLYEAINRGDCELMVAYKQEFETNKRRQDTNPNCNLERQGRQIRSLKDTFSTKLDPGVRCTDLVNEVFSYYFKELEDNGLLEQWWTEHSEFYGTQEHCQNDIPDNSSRRRFLKASGAKGGAAGGGAAAATAASMEESTAGSEEDIGRLSLNDMAGTMILQVAGSIIAILVTLLSKCEKKTNTKRQIKMSQRKIKLMERRSQRNIMKLADEDFSYNNHEDLNIDEEYSEDLALRLQLSNLSKQLAALTNTVDKMQDALNQKQRKCSARSLTKGTMDQFEENDNSSASCSSSTRSPASIQGQYPSTSNCNPIPKEYRIEWTKPKRDGPNDSLSQPSPLNQEQIPEDCKIQWTKSKEDDSTGKTLAESSSSTLGQQPTPAQANFKPIPREYRVEWTKTTGNKTTFKKALT